jgi:outer membrane protein assembly factor BamB
MMSLVSETILWATIAAMAPADTANWPQFRGPTGDGQSAAHGLPLAWSETAHLAWQTPIHGRGWSSPVVWGDQVWLTTAPADGHQAFAIAVDRRNGRILHDIKVFDVAQPQEIHKLNSYASPTPVIEAGRVYVHFGAHGTACLDTGSGQILWSRRDLPCNHYRGPGSSPILLDNLLIVHFDGSDVQYVVALDKSTGKTVWKTDRSTDFAGCEGDFRKAFSTPIVIEVHGRRQLLSPGSEAAMAYDPATGAELWKVHFKGFSSTMRPLAWQNLVLIATGFGKSELWAVRPDGHGDVTDSHVVWKLRKGVPSKPSAVLWGDLLFMVHDNGLLSCVEVKTGHLLWQEHLHGQYSASLLAAEGRIYCFSQAGKTTVVEAGRSYKLLAENSLNDGFMASAAVTGRSLILRTEKRLLRID